MPIAFDPSTGEIIKSSSKENQDQDNSSEVIIDAPATPEIAPVKEAPAPETPIIEPIVSELIETPAAGFPIEPSTSRVEETPASPTEFSFSQRIAAQFREENIVFGNVIPALADTIMWQRALTSDMNKFFFDDPTFNLGKAIEEIPEDERLLYSWCVNQDQVNAQREHIENEKIDRRAKEEAGFWESTLANIINYTTDPINIANAAVASDAAAAITAITTPVLGPVAPVAGTIAWGTTFFGLHETEMYFLKNLRTKADVINAAIINGLITPGLAIGGKVLKKAVDQFVKFGKELWGVVKPKSSDVMDLIEGVDYHIKTGDEPYQLTLIDGALHTVPVNGGNPTAIANLPNVLKPLFKLSSSGEAAVHPYETVNKLGEMFFGNTFTTNAMIENPLHQRGPAVDSLVNLDRAKVVEGTDYYFSCLDNVLKFYKNSNTSFTRKDFDAELHKAIINGGEHQDPTISAYAKWYLTDEYVRTEEAILQKALPNLNLDKNLGEGYLSEREANLDIRSLLRQDQFDQVTDLSHYSRVYDKQAIMLNERIFTNRIARGDIKHAKQSQEQELHQTLMEIDKTYEESLKKIEETRLEASQNYLGKNKKVEEARLLRDATFSKMKAEETKQEAIKEAQAKIKSDAQIAWNARISAKAKVETILGTNQDRHVSSMEILIENPSMAKQRTVYVHDGALAEFLVKDPLANFQRSHDILDHRVAMQKGLRSYGYKSMEEVYDALNKEYATKRQDAAAKGKDKPEVKQRELVQKAENEYKDAVRMTQMIPELVAGIYGRESAMAHPYVNKSLNIIRNYNYIRLLTGQTISAWQDAAMVLKEFGVRAIPEFLNDLAITIGLATKKEKKIQTGLKKMIKSFSVALDSSRHIFVERQINEKFDSSIVTPSTTSTFGRALNMTEAASAKMASINTSISGINVHNDFFQTLNAKLFVNYFTQLLLKPKKTSADLREITKHRFPTGMVKRFKEQFDAHGEIIDDYHLSNSQLFTDPEVKEAFNAAVLTHTYNTIVVPGPGDVPAFFHTQMGKFFVSFKNITFSMMNKITQELATGTAKHPFVAIASGLGLGVMIKYLKGWINDDPPDIRDPELYFDAIAGMDALATVGEGLKLFHDCYKAATNRHGINFHERMVKLSPNASMVADLFQLGAKGIQSGAQRLYGEEPEEVYKPVSEKKLRALMLWIPYNAHPIIRSLVTRGIRSYVESEGGTLMKTRKERYAEEYGE
jgi:hypothetical protein